MNSALKSTEKYVLNLLSGKLPSEYYYHNIDHTIDVVNTAKLIADNSNVSPTDTEMLLIACWFHDSGLTQIYQGHEDISVILAENFLFGISYPQPKINIIKRIILATKMPHIPCDILEKIISDADISHMGKDNFDARSHQLRMEWEIVYNRTYSEEEWLDINIRFLGDNLFFSDYCIQEMNPVRLKNLEIYKKRLYDLKKINEKTYPR